ncbi:MAG: twin-arginine translocation signal domain-containing protein, partial [Anaerolineae bacterium]|nr:twin-arginine translocation signal domain-containing protein [Anaerolineae bacterium]
MTKKDLSRRHFLGLALAGGVTAGLGVKLSRPSESEDAGELAQTARARYALIIDTTKCTGCQACVEACNLRNDLPEGQSYIHGRVKGDEHLTFSP